MSSAACGEWLLIYELAAALCAFASSPRLDAAERFLLSATAETSHRTVSPW
jgi:hypothetical protein